MCACVHSDIPGMVRGGACAVKGEDITRLSELILVAVNTVNPVKIVIIRDWLDSLSKHGESLSIFKWW